MHKIKTKTVFSVLSSHRRRGNDCCGHDATLGRHEVVGADGVFRGHELKVVALLLQLHHQFDVELLRREHIQYIWHLFWLYVFEFDWPILPNLFMLKLIRY